MAIFCHYKRYHKTNQLLKICIMA